MANRITGSIQCITYGQDERGRGLWVAGVNSSGPPYVSLLYSYNGLDWIAIVNSAQNTATNVTSVAYGINASTGRRQWIATIYRSSGHSFIQSLTGRDGWGAVLNTKTGLFNGSGGTCITYANGIWYATGISTAIISGRSLAYSYDGSGGWFGIVPYSNMYTAASSSYTPIQTLNLTVWGVASTNDYMIPANITPIRASAWTAGVGSAYLQHQTLVFGTEKVMLPQTNTVTTRNVCAVSSDGGRTWGASVTNTHNSSSTVSIGRSAFRGGVCNDAVWNGRVWVAVGLDSVTGAKVATSKDGISWTQIPTANIPIDGVVGNNFHF
jgi:hypothetical protein